MDGFDLAHAHLIESPDVRSWPATTTITELTIGAQGVSLVFDTQEGPGQWPEVIPPGWDGGIQYTLWIAMQIAGEWYAVGVIEFWFGRESTGPGDDITQGNKVAKDWTYFAPPLNRQPAAGELVGFFVTSGDQRRKDVSTVKERSNIVVVPFPAQAGTVFTFDAAAQPAPPGPAAPIPGPQFPVPIFTADQFVNREANEVASAYRAAHDGNDPAPSDMYQQAWKRLVEQQPQAKILAEI